MKVFRIPAGTTVLACADVRQPGELIENTLGGGLMTPHVTKQDNEFDRPFLDATVYSNDQPELLDEQAHQTGWNMGLWDFLVKEVTRSIPYRNSGYVFIRTNGHGQTSAMLVDPDDVEIL